MLLGVRKHRDAALLPLMTDAVDKLADRRATRAGVEGLVMIDAILSRRARSLELRL